MSCRPGLDTTSVIYPTMNNSPTTLHLRPQYIYPTPYQSLPSTTPPPPVLSHPLPSTTFSLYLIYTKFSSFCLTNYTKNVFFVISDQWRIDPDQSTNDQSTNLTLNPLIIGPIRFWMIVINSGWPPPLVTLVILFVSFLSNPFPLGGDVLFAWPLTYL